MAQKRAMDERAKRAHARLWRIWKEREGKPLPNGEILTQVSAGRLMNVSQPAVNNWLKGKRPLGPLAVLRFARLLEVSPMDIDPEWDLTDEALAALDRDEVKIVGLYASLDPEARKQVDELVKFLAQRSISDVS